MAEHTKEPWAAHVSGFRASSHSYRIMGWNLTPVAETKVGSGDVGEANAVRIVACVNACKSMADPAAEIAELRAIADAARTYLAGWYGGDGGRLPMSKYRSNLFDALERADIRCK